MRTQVITMDNKESRSISNGNRGIHADVIVSIFAHLHTTLRTEENFAC